METSPKKIFKAFTLIELMIVVAIVAILAAVAVPAYTGYIRRSYVSEATSSISAIKSAEESFFTLNGCYIETAVHPAQIPAANQMSWNVTPMPIGWGNNALAVRPDKNVRFQYQVYANNSLGCGDPTTDLTASNNSITNGCGPSTNFASSGGFIDTDFFPDQYYLVVARGDLDGDNAGAEPPDADSISVMFSAIDDKTIVTCNETE